MKRKFYDVSQKEVVVESYGLKLEKELNEEKKQRVIQKVIKECFQSALENLGNSSLFDSFSPRIIQTGGPTYCTKELTPIQDGFYLIGNGWNTRRATPSQVAQHRRPLEIESPETFNPEFLEMLSKFNNNENQILEDIRANIYSYLNLSLLSLSEYYGENLVEETCEELNKMFDELRQKNVEVHICKNLSVKIRIDLPFSKGKWILIKF